MWAVLAVFVKEVQDNMRDRRSALAALIYPVLGPLLFAGLLQVTGQALSGGGPNMELPVAGIEDAPSLSAFLAARSVRVVPAPADIEPAVRQGRVPMVLMVEPRFDAKLGAGAQARLTVVNDASRLAGEVSAARLTRLLQDYAKDALVRRLEARGMTAAEAQPVSIENVAFATRRQAADLLVYLVPPFIMFTVFIGGVYLAIDSTSGERERGSLEPLLTTPVPRWQIMLGKYLGAYLFTAVALMVQLAAFGLAFATASPGQFTPGTGYGPGTAVRLFLVAVPLMAFTVAVQIIIAALTRSFKEAQTWLGLLPLVPAVPGLVMVFMPVQGKLWMMLVPVLGQTVIMGQAVRAEAVEPLHHAAAAAATLLAAALLLRWAARLFEREEMVFGAG